MVNPRLLCRKHLLGEHGEIHKHRHNFVKRHSIDKRIELGQIEPKSMKQRHDELADEMVRRGYNHNSPYIMPDLSHLPVEQQEFVVDKKQSVRELHERCPECLELSRTEKERR